MGEIETPHATGSGVTRVVRTARALVAYVVFGAGVLALWAFFAPHVGAPAFWPAAAPVVPAPTESDTIVDVAPLIAGVVAAAVGVWLR